jgi:hypothetical protein
VHLVRRANVTIVLGELNEYAHEVDVAFVRRSIQAIGQIARLKDANALCVDILVKLLENRAEYTVEESVVVLCDIIRTFPGKFDGEIAPICSHLDKLKEARAVAAGIWIIGEYASAINDPDAILEAYVDAFEDHRGAPVIQLAILAAVVKVYCADEKNNGELLESVLSSATKRGNSVDVRGRALLYWRVLSTGREAMKAVLGFARGEVSEVDTGLSADVVTLLEKHMDCCAGVLAMLPGEFVKKSRGVPASEARQEFVPVTMSAPWLKGAVSFAPGRMQLKLECTTPLSGFRFAMNQNGLGLSVSSSVPLPASLSPGESNVTTIPVSFEPTKAVFVRPELQFALGTSKGVVYGSCPLPVELAVTKLAMDVSEFRQFFAANAACQIERTLASAEVKEGPLHVADAGPPVCVSFGLFGTRFAAELQPDAGGARLLLRADSPRFMGLFAMQGIVSALFVDENDGLIAA